MLVNNTLSNIIIFTAGAAVGSVATYMLLKKKSDQRVKDEIDNFYKNEESYAKNKDITIADVVEAAVKEGIDVNFRVESKEDEDMAKDKAEYEEIVKGEGYTSYQKEKLGVKEDKNKMKEPYVIPPEEYGECDYPTVSLWYYSDGVLTNDRNKIIKNAEELVGEGFEEHFGEYEDDSVFVRNDELEIDYEILRDERKYSEID